MSEKNQKNQERKDIFVAAAIAGLAASGTAVDDHMAERCIEFGMKVVRLLQYREVALAPTGKTMGELSFSTRAITVIATMLRLDCFSKADLKAFAITDLAELLQYTEKEVKYQRSCGQKTLKEIIDKLSLAGFSLRKQEK